MARRLTSNTVAQPAKGQSALSPASADSRVFTQPRSNTAVWPEAAFYSNAQPLVRSATRYNGPLATGGVATAAPGRRRVVGYRSALRRGKGRHGSF
jgi:hypothetical protein